MKAAGGPPLPSGPGDGAATIATGPDGITRPQIVGLRKVLAVKPQLAVHVGDNETILVETDADAEYDKQGRLAIRCEPGSLEIAGKSPLRGGRVRWRLRPTGEATIGKVGKIIVTLTKPDGQQLIDETEYEILPPYEVKGKKAPDLVPPFEIVPISPEANPREWETAWPDQPEEDRSQVAYKSVNAGGKTIVYYSTIFEPFLAQVQKLSSAAMTEAFKINYSVWIGYHAILQDRDRKLMDTSLDDVAVDALLETDRATVGKMQVKQAMKTAELMLKTQGAAAEPA